MNDTDKNQAKTPPQQSAGADAAKDEQKNPPETPEAGARQDNQEGLGKNHSVEYGGQVYDVPQQYVTGGQIDMEALLKANQDMRGKLREDGPRVDKTFAVPEDIQIDVESPLYQNIRQVAADRGMSAEAFGEMLKVYADTVDMPGQYKSLQQRWGEQTGERLEKIEQYWLGEIDAKDAPPEVGVAFAQLAESAAGVVFLEYMMGKARAPSLPGAPQDNRSANLSAATIQDLVALKKSAEYQKGNPEAKRRAQQMAHILDKK